MELGISFAIQFFKIKKRFSDFGSNYVKVKFNLN
jgi:hypothetical protein